MKLKTFDITEQDLKRISCTWHGPVFFHPHTGEKIQQVLDRHGLDLIIGELDNGHIYLDIVPKPEHVDSSMLDDISYDETTKKMCVTFRHGSQYEYYDVEKAIFAGLQESESKGKFFLKHIKSKYACKQLE